MIDAGFGPDPKSLQAMGRFSVDGKSVAMLIRFAYLLGSGELPDQVLHASAIILSVAGSTILVLEIVTSTSLTNS